MLPKSIYYNCVLRHLHWTYNSCCQNRYTTIVKRNITRRIYLYSVGRPITLSKEIFVQIYTWARYKSRIVINPMEVNPVTSKDVFRYCWYSSLTLDLKVPIEGTCCHHRPMNNNRNDNCYNDLFRNFGMTFLDSPDDLIWCVRLNRYRDVLRFTLESSWYIQVSNRMRWLGIDIKFSAKSGGIIRPT